MISSVDLEALIRDLFDQQHEIDAYWFRQVLLRNQLALVPISQAERLTVSKLMERLRPMAVQVRVGSGALQDAVLLDEIGEEIEDILP